MKEFISFVKDFLTARETGQGYFGGAEGALRSAVFGIIIAIAAIIYFLVA